MPSFQRNGDHALIFGAYAELSRHSAATQWQELPAASVREKRPRSNTATPSTVPTYVLSPRNCDGLYLAIGQSLLFAEGVGLASVPVQHALVERSNPQIRFRARERCDIKIAQRRVKDGYFLSVVERARRASWFQSRDVRKQRARPR